MLNGLICTKTDFISGPFIPEFRVELMVAGRWPFRDFAKEVMNSELESVQFGQKGMGTCTRKVKKRCSNAKMHFGGKNNMSAASKKPKYASL